MVLFGTYYGINRLEGVLHRPSEPARLTGHYFRVALILLVEIREFVSWVVLAAQEAFYPYRNRQVCIYIHR
jgi:hypothetical protein